MVGRADAGKDERVLFYLFNQNMKHLPGTEALHGLREC